jgi:hypothetical protein
VWVKPMHSESLVLIGLGGSQSSSGCSEKDKGCCPTCNQTPVIQPLSWYRHFKVMAQMYKNQNITDYDV